MIKSLPLSILTSAFFFCTFFQGPALAQSKKENKENRSKKTEVSTEGLSPVHGLPVAQQPVERKSRRSQDEFLFVVFVNTNDPEASRIWEELPQQFPDIKTAQVTAYSGMYILLTQDPELALFQKAYGAYFRVFKESELDYFGNILPCLAELRPTITSMAKKIKGQ